MRDFDNIYNEYTDDELIEMFKEHDSDCYIIPEPIVSEFDDRQVNVGTLIDLERYLNEETNDMY